MFGFLRQALTLLTRAEKRRFYLILALSAFAALMQTLSVLSMMPFIVLLANPDMLQDHGLLQRVYQWVGAASYQEFLVLFGLFGILVLTLGNMFVAFEQWVSDRFLNHLIHRVETVVLQRMMSKPYDYFVTNHSATLSDIILNQVERAIEGVIGTFITILGSVVLAGSIVSMLLLISFQTTLVTSLGLLVAYVLVFLLLRRKIQSHGAELTDLSAKVFIAVKETLDGIKEIKTRRAASFFIHRFNGSRHKLAHLAVRYNLLSYLPHFLLESIVLAGFVAVSLYFVYVTADSGISLSFIALYGMAIYRLIPALKGIFEGISSVHHNTDAVQLVVRHLEEPQPRRSHRSLVPPRKHIKLAGITHRYANSDRDQLSELMITIPVGSSICLYGPSGSGKTTVFNILAGLIYPRTGAVLCDDVEVVPEVLDGWRQIIGYCPQQIYLYDDTLASNIAFGIDSNAIDEARVSAVGRIARLEEFVLEKLPGGYQAVIGEHGSTLSGGQRQRVGIARCLYHDPEVLLFDESFNGLDAGNRTAILDSLFSLPGKTLVFSSHETDIASRCDNIVMMEQGKVVGEGTYELLMAELPRFEQLASRCGP
jgi:ATP-binding cassette, subfamily B, bacterial PglK